MGRPLTSLGGLLLLVIAGAQAYRAMKGFDVTIDTFHVPVIASWAAAAIAGLLGLATLAGR